VTFGRQFDREEKLLGATGPFSREGLKAREMRVFGLLGVHALGSQQLR
jgi:hypothetical protein